MEAFWKGGRDGGVWIWLEDVRSERFSAIVFHDTGEVWTEGWFVASEGRNAETIDREWLRRNISAFDGTEMLLVDRQWVFRLDKARSRSKRER
jgi:hypothetical protein